MEITINGKQKEVPAKAGVRDLLKEEGVDPDVPGIAIAVNDEVVRKDRWPETVIRAGDRIEIVTAKQGG